MHCYAIVSKFTKIELEDDEIQIISYAARSRRKHIQEYVTSVMKTFTESLTSLVFSLRRGG